MGFPNTTANDHIAIAVAMISQCYGENLRCEECKVKALIAIAEALIAVASKMKG